MKNASGRLQEQYEDVSKSICSMKDISCEEDDVLATDVKKIRESKAVFMRTRFWKCWKF